MLVLSALIFLAGETTQIMFLAIHYKTRGISTGGLINIFGSNVLVYVIAALLQFTALLLVGARKTAFVKTCAVDDNRIITADSIKNLLNDYEVLKRGIGPLIALLFCIHAPVILCFTYFVLAYAKQFSLGIIGHCGTIGWSSLTLIHTCLMAEDCYDALQDLLPTLRWQALEQADWRLREELHQLERMVARVERFSAMSFFTVDRSTLLGVMSTVVTYLVILLQAK